MAAAEDEAGGRGGASAAMRAARVAASVLLVLALIGAAAWLAFGGDGGKRTPPVIAAESDPERLPPDPDRPNGAVVAHQDQIVYEIARRGDSAVDAPGLAPAAEQPVAPPKPLDPPVVTDGTAGPVQLLPPNPAPDRIDPNPRASQTSPPPPRSDPPAPEVAATEPAQPAPSPREVAALPSSDRQAPPEPAAPPVAADPAPTAAAPATSSDGGGRYRIQIGAVRDKATAQREWRRLRQSNQDVLGGLQLFLQEVSIADRGVFHRIQAGPLPEKILAEIACDRLKSRKVPCFVVAK